MPDCQLINFAICFEAMLDAFGSVEGMAINI